MTSRRELLFLQDIIKYCDTIATAVKRGEKAFIADPLLRLGVEKCIENIGEAAKYVSDETKAISPEIPWRQITGMRNILTHCYFASDPHEIWKTAAVDIPALRDALQPLFEYRKERDAEQGNSQGM